MFERNFTVAMGSQGVMFCPTLAPVRQFVVAIVAYPLFKIPTIGQFYHTAPMICPQGILQGSIRGQAQHLFPEIIMNCIEFPYYSDSLGVTTHAPGQWPNARGSTVVDIVPAGEIQGHSHNGKPDALINDFIKWGSSCQDGKTWLDFNPGTYDMLNHNCNMWTVRVLEHLGLASGLRAMKQFALENILVNQKSRLKLDKKSKMVPVSSFGMSPEQFNGGHVLRISPGCQRAMM
jgi:hypothetical protein